MNPIILYHSRTGFTQQYATWLSEDLRCAALPYRQRGDVDFSRYDTVLFGSWFQAGRIMGKAWLVRQLPRWADKQVILFVTGAAPEGEGQLAAMERNFTAEQWGRLHPFYLPGGLRYDRMGAADRAMMAVFCRMLRAREGTGSPAYQALSQSFDLSDREKLRPIVDFCGEMK